MQVQLRINRLFWILPAFLLYACVESLSAPATDAVVVSSFPTPTPFQPLPLETQPPSFVEIAPTYTPYPTRQVLGETLPTPILVSPPLGGAASEFRLLNTYNPLTGLPVADPSLLERRPLAIKVANAPDYVRPQSGLSLADVVYEYYIEWGDTRFIAVMYGNDSPMVGPVRSGRYFDEHVARMYNAFLVFKFADPREYSYLKNSTLNEFLVVPGSSSCPPFAFGPEKKRDAYNNFFFNTTKWANCAARAGLDNSKPDLNGGFFAEDTGAGGVSAKRIYSFYSRYSYNYWEYDPVFRKYFRYQEANDIVGKKAEAYVPLFDAQTGLPVTAANVVVLFVPHTFQNQFDAEDEVYHIDLIDSGSAYVFRDGYAVPAIWRRAGENQPLLLTTLTGAPIYLRPGQTFYQVMGFTSAYAQEGENWKFVFKTP